MSLLNLTYPDDPFDILPEEWRELIKKKVKLEGIHWLYQNTSKQGGKYVITVQNRTLCVSTLLFQLVFKTNGPTVSKCEIENCIGPLCQREKKMTPDERFAKFSERLTEPNENGCQFYIDDTKMRTIRNDDGIAVFAHVYACDRQYKEEELDPSKTHVGHKCKSPVDENGKPMSNNCVAKDHLERVTPPENAAKKKIDGTQRSGDSHPGSKVADAQIPVIRQRLKDGEMVCEVAEDYGVSPCTISAIVNGKRSGKKVRSDQIPTKNDLLIAYFHLCERQTEYLESGCIKTDLACAYKQYPLIFVLNRIRKASFLIGSIKNNFTLMVQPLQGCHERFCEGGGACAAFDHVRCDLIANNKNDEISDAERERVMEIYGAFRKGMTRKEIVVKFDVTYARVCNICSGKSYSFLTGHVYVPTEVKSIPVCPTERPRKKNVVDEFEENSDAESESENLVAEREVETEFFEEQEADEESKSTNAEIASTSSQIATKPDIDLKYSGRYSAERTKAVEIIYSLYSGLTLEERAEKYGKSIRFLTELDKALTFVQPTEQNKNLLNYTKKKNQTKINLEKKHAIQPLVKKRKQSSVEEILAMTPGVKEVIEELEKKRKIEKQN